ncbi:MAG: PqqD family protein [Deltaproteobacteria bacterium]
MNEDEMLSIRPEPVPGAMCREEQFGAMLVVGNMPILNLNKDAKQLWELCDGRKTIAEIEAVLNEEYDEGQLRTRLLEFFSFCFQNGLLVQVDC